MVRRERSSEGTSEVLSGAPDPDPVTDTGPAGEIAHERRATNLELFLDLVFVFAVTQVATVLRDDPTPEGVGRGVLLAALVWWLWSQFAWLGTVVDLDRHPSARLAVLAAVPPTLLIAVALPHALDTAGMQFAAAYLVVHVWCLAIQGRAMWDEPATRRAWLQYGPLAALASVVLLAGSLCSGPTRTAVWAAVAVFDIVAALSAGREGEAGATHWHIDPSHFAERHALFLIISLGEVMVAAGAAASSTDLVPIVGIGLVVSVGLACVLWWMYFAYVSGVAERFLRNATGVARGRVARDLFTFGHFPIVLGVVLYAVAVHHLVADPSHPLHGIDLIFLGASIALFVGGFMGLHWQMAHRVAPERPVAIAVTVGLCAVAGPRVAGAALVALVAVTVGGAQAVTLRRYRRVSASGRA